MKHLLVFITTLALVGCQPVVWVKPGASQNDFSRDKYACMQQAQQRVSNAKVDAYSGQASNKVITNEGLFNSCMNANGWYLNHQDEAQRQVHSAQNVQASAQQQKAENINQAKSQLSKIAQEGRDACAKPERKIIYDKSACQVDSISLDQLSDKGRITAAEKTVFMEIYSENRERGRRASAAFRSAGDPKGRDFAALVNRTEDRVEKNALELYEGKISWGEFNKARKEIAASHRAEFNRLSGGK